MRIGAQQGRREETTTMQTTAFEVVDSDSFSFSVRCAM